MENEYWEGRYKILLNAKNHNDKELEFFIDKCKKLKLFLEEFHKASDDACELMELNGLYTESAYKTLKKLSYATYRDFINEIGL